MEEALEKPAQTARRWRSVRTAMCWLYGIGGMVSGHAIASAPGAWPNDRVSGGILAVGSLALLPPILRGLRNRLPFARSIAAPMVYALLLGAIAPVAGKPFEPSTAAQARLQHVAMLRAQALLREGKPAAARAALRKFADRRRADPELAALLARLDNDMPAAMHRRQSDGDVLKAAPVTAPVQDPASAYVERVETYWLPEVLQMAESPPADAAAIGRLLTQIDGMAVNIADGERLTLNPSQRAAWGRLLDALAAKQKRLLPALRRRYADELRAKLFRRDVEVAASGPKNSTLRFTGPVFARNANIEDLQTANASVITRMRFRRTDYHWSTYVDGGYHYDLDVPADGVVATWDGSTFTPAGR